MRKVLIVRHGAYGDIIHMTHLPELLKDNGFDFVGVSTGWKGKQILSYNPYINKLHYMEFGGLHITEHFYDKRLEVISEEYDKVIDLTQTIELAKLAFENQCKYYLDQETRAKDADENYYDVATREAGYQELCGKYKGQLYFSDKEVSLVEHDLLRPGRFKDNFKVMLNLAGSSPHKVLIQSREIARQILDKYPEAIIFTTGDKRVKPIECTDISSRVHTLVGKKPFRQVLCMVKYMDCVIGCESGLMCGASVFGTPAVQLMTAACLNNHVKYADNDFSIQSPAKCSPCFKGPYDYFGCPTKDNLPLCVFFDVDTIINQVDKAYSLWNQRMKDFCSKSYQNA